MFFTPPGSVPGATAMVGAVIVSEKACVGPPAAAAGRPPVIGRRARVPCAALPDGRTGVDGGRAGQERDRLRRAAIVPQRAEQGGMADDVVVRVVVREAARRGRVVDQVVCAREGA